MISVDPTAGELYDDLEARQAAAVAALRACAVAECLCSRQVDPIG